MIDQSVSLTSQSINQSINQNSLRRGATQFPSCCAETRREAGALFVLGYPVAETLFFRTCTCAIVCVCVRAFMGVTLTRQKMPQHSVFPLLTVCGVSPGFTPHITSCPAALSAPSYIIHGLLVYHIVLHTVSTAVYSGCRTVA